MSRKLLLIILNFSLITLVAQEASSLQEKERALSRIALSKALRKYSKYGHTGRSKRDFRTKSLKLKKDSGRRRHVGSYKQPARRKHRTDYHCNANSNGDTEFIYDVYTDRRGAPKMLEIFCCACDTKLMSYQKDGFGRLLRCYLDRIHSPQRLKDRQYRPFDVNNSAFLTCNRCLRIIGRPMIYQLENRPAYRMIQKSFYFR